MGRMQMHPTRYPTDLSDEEWEYIQSLVPTPNLEKENAADQSSWIAAIWSTRSFTKCVRVAPGGCCPKILALGKPSMATTGSGARIGPGHSFTTRCGTVCAKPRSERLTPPQRAL